MKKIMLLMVLFIVNAAMSQVNTDQAIINPDYDLFVSNTVRSAADEIEEVTQGTLFSLNEVALSSLRSAEPQTVVLTIPIEHGEDLVLNLQQADIFSDDFILESSGEEDVSQADLGLHYHGTVEGEKNSVIAISVFDDQIRGTVVIEEDNYNLGPIELGSNDYICYKSADLNSDIKSDLNYSCSSIETGLDVYSDEDLNFAQKVLGDAVAVYVEVDKSIYDRQGGNFSAALSYTTSLFNQNAAIYAQEGIGTVTSQIFIWTTTDPYDGVNGCSSDVRDEYLCDFQSQFAGFNGDLAILLIDENIGGVAAGFNGICNANPDLSMCISGQSGTTVNTFPTYSYNTYIFAHELGHLFGSRHTHACVWNGNNTAIDGCETTEGSCPQPPIPASGSATVMSYCQTQLAGGYISSAPFGFQPGNVIRASVAGAGCLGCASPTIYIPSETSAGPAVYLCPGDDVPEGYVIAGSQSCAQSVIDSDPFCLGNNGGTWDGICQNAYNTCLDDCSIYIPNASTTGPAVYVCPGETVPTGYVLAGFQECAQSVIDEDPFCLENSWDGVCVTAYLSCVGGCSTGFSIYLPEIGVSGPAEIVCTGDTPPSGYFFASSQSCAREIIENDQYCLTTLWDGICRGAYEECNPPTCTDGIQNGDEEGVDCGGLECPACPCPGASTIYLPVDPTTGPAVIVCAGDPGPSGYIAAPSQPCAQAVIDFDPFCLTNTWDNLCQTRYDDCTGEGCTGVTTTYLPDVVSGGPAIQGCGLVPAGYSAADDQECAETVIVEDPFCLNTNWDGVCQGDYVTCIEGGDCDVFSTAPVDLTKSFDPVNGIQDRVQVKWFKASPQIRYSDEDAAMCDIKFWPKRNLIPGTTTPTGPVIVAGFNDTIMIVDAKKTYGDNSPREIFKWPVKFRKNSDSPNAKRADPNIRYEWQVRCECGHDGFGPESPWSDVKIFNTPDFDPETGIFSLPPGAFSDDELKTLAEMNLLLMPNPASHHLRIQNADGLLESFDWIIMDMTGRVMDKGAVRKNKSSYLELDVSVLAQGSYHIMVVGTQYSASSPFLIKR